MDALLSALNDFHWLRPLWLLALLPALLLTLLLWRQGHQARQWRQLIAPELLRHLVDSGSRQKRHSYLWGLLVAWLIGVFALAGPTWEKRPMPVHRAENALMIILDLSPSMLAEDLTPSRLVRARLKIADVLRERKEGFTGLIAYAGDAHAVSPLTDDTATIRSLLTALHPNIMPTPGSRPEAAIDMAKQLFEDAGITEGQILLITDGVVEKAVNSMLDQLEGTDFRLSVLGVGTAEGAPIPNERGGFVRNRQGEIVVAQLEQDRLERLAGRTGGRYERIDASADDVEWLLETPAFVKSEERELEREFDVWQDRGHWLALLLLPIVLFSFRRGLLAVVVALPLLGLLAPQPAQAQDWLAPWLTPDQRGARALAQEQPKEAAERFENPEWKGSALYRAEDYKAAAEAFAQSDSARADYNRGNAMARAGDLEAALEAYESALEKSPDMSDAQANKALVQRLLEQKQQQKQQNQQQQDGEKQGDQSDQEQSQQGEGSDSSQGQQSQDPSDQQGQKNQGQNQGGESQSSRSGEEGSEGQSGEQQSSSAQGESGQQASEGQQQSSRSAGAQGEAQDGQEGDARAQGARLEEGDVSDEERQSMEQWLRRVPDDPGGLLRRKFEYQSQQRRLERLRGETEGEGTEERW
ncbi:VWA domain-containing protein [Marinimicrobium agarilyticum]|uniref:VWA domain-containing protein n=1 Tax=Marinimicrobium agarilyticum TaxID=306546 RepID=UPI0003F8C641|nr:VWA domain-containing protein [Marinimicrobium agarilyticum]